MSVVPNFVGGAACAFAIMDIHMNGGSNVRHSTASLAICMLACLLVHGVAPLLASPAITWVDVPPPEQVAVKGGGDALYAAERLLHNQAASVIIGTVIATEPVFLSTLCWYRTQVTVVVEQCFRGPHTAADTLQFVATNSVAPCRDGSGWYCIGESTDEPWVLRGDTIVAALIEQTINSIRTGHLCNVYVGFLHRLEMAQDANEVLVYGESSFAYDGRAYMAHGSRDPNSPYDFMSIERSAIANLAATVAVLVGDVAKGER